MPASRSLTTHETTKAISHYLSDHGVTHEVVEHPVAYTAASEARAAGVLPQEAAKTVVLQDGGAYMLAIIPASERLDLHKVRELLGATRSLRLATEDEIAQHYTQFEVGAVPPVGPVLFTGEVVDRRIAELDRVLCSGGDHRHSISLDPKAIVELADAKVADICED